MTGAELARRTPTSVEDIVDIEWLGPRDAAPRLLLDVPHGATRDEHFERWSAKLRSTLPDDLVEFFRVNTDFGAPELARAIGARWVEHSGGEAAIVLRGLVPRTLLDLNREPVRTGPEELTPGVPPWIREPADVARLTAAWLSYQRTATTAHDIVCDSGGLAIAVHTYAPRSVEIDRFDDDIVRTLREAYRPKRFESWALRPEVDLIVPNDDDPAKIHEAWVARAADRLVAAGFEVGHSQSYRLVAGTLAHRHAVDHPNATACVEVRRDLIGAPWRPFEPSRVDRNAVDRVAAALADAVSSSLAR